MALWGLDDHLWGSGHLLLEFQTLAPRAEARGRWKGLVWSQHGRGMVERAISDPAAWVSVHRGGWTELSQILGLETSCFPLTLSDLGSGLDNKGAQQGGENTNQEVTLFFLKEKL